MLSVSKNHTFVNKQYVESGKQTVSHNADGTKNVGIDCKFYSGPGGWNAIPTAYVDLPKIPRQANILTYDVYSVDETSIGFKYTADKYIEDIHYCLNSGDWAPGGNPKTISGLAPNTQYSVQIRVLANGLWTYSDVKYATTYDYPNPKSITDFVIGEGARVVVNNPLNRIFKLELISNNDGSVIGVYEGSYNAEINGEFKTPDAIDKQYKSIPNSSSGTYYAKFTYGSSVRTLGNKTYRIKGDEKPTFNDFDWETNDYSNLTGDSQTIIKGFSSIKTIVSNNNKAVAQKSASIKSYQTIIGTKSKTNSTITYPVETTVNNIDALIISVFANDSRGLSTKVDKPISNFIDLIPLSINKMEVDRTPNNDEEVNLKIEGVIDTVDFGQVVNAINRSRYYYKLKESSTYIEGSTNLQFTYEKITGTQHKFFINQTIEGDIEDGFSSNGEYDIKVTISDKLTEVTKETSLEQGSPAIAILGNNVALGAPYNEKVGGRVQINGQEAGDTLKVSSIEPGSGVWFKKSNNLFDISGSYKAQTGSPTINGNVISLPQSSGNGGYTKFDQIIEIDGPITLSANISDGNGYARFILMPLDINTNVITNLSIEGYSYLSAYGGYWKDLPNGKYELTLNFPSNVKYFRLGFVHIYSTFENVQIEKGTTATPYNPFTDKKIYTKNSNDGYDVFYDIESVEQKINQNISSINTVSDNLAGAFRNLGFNTVDEFRNWIVNNAPVGVFLVYLNINGGISACVVMKASNNYLSYIRFSYSLSLEQARYANGTWY